MYDANTMMSFGQVVVEYDNYCKRERANGNTPASFLRYITGRY